MRHPSASLPVAATLLLLVGASSLRAQVEDFVELLRGSESEVAAVGRAIVRSSADGWLGTGVEVKAGQNVTVFGFGDGVGARVWVRIGDADIVNLGSPSWSFEAWDSGEIEIAALPPRGRWERCDGSLTSGFDPGDPVEMQLDVVAAVWTGGAEQGLSALGQHPTLDRARRELARTRPLPAGFRSVCYLGRTNDFEAFEEGDRRGVWGNAASSAGIIKKAVDLPLDASSVIEFEWRYDALHSLGPETDSRYHDYSSIAVELDNGQDITWMRSPHLEAGTSFHCPLDWWDQRETHIVLQGGRENLHEWQSHTRPILADYEKAVGGEPPKRIVGVWFISVGVFGGTTPDTKYANVVLRSAERTVKVFE